VFCIFKKVYGNYQEIWVREPGARDVHRDKSRKRRVRWLDMKSLYPSLLDTDRHENSWRHRRHASGTKKMRNQYAEDRKFASVLTITYINEATIALFSGITLILST
jgi:hypothetical protein